MNYKAKYKQLVAEAHKKGLHVSHVKDKATRDFVGMNPQAAKAFGFKVRTNTIMIDKNLNLRDKCLTLNHELIEVDLMKKGMKYWPAHKRALKLERKL